MTRGGARPQQVGGRPHSRRSPGGLAHQSRELARYFGKSPRNFMPRSETVCANLGICILSHLLEHSLYTVLHLKHLNFVLYIETPKFTRGSRGREQTARPSGAVIELRHEEAAAHGLNHRWRHEEGADHSTLTPNKLRAVFELRHEEAAPSRYNHGVEPAMATRGGRRPRFEPSMATRGRRRPQRANSAQGAGRHRVTTRGSRTPGWHHDRDTRTPPTTAR